MKTAGSNPVWTALLPEPALSAQALVVAVGDPPHGHLAAPPEAEVTEEQAAYNNTENEHGFHGTSALDRRQEMGV